MDSLPGIPGTNPTGIGTFTVEEPYKSFPSRIMYVCEMKNVFDQVWSPRVQWLLCSLYFMSKKRETVTTCLSLWFQVVLWNTCYKMACSSCIFKHVLQHSRVTSYNDIDCCATLLETVIVHSWHILATAQRLCIKLHFLKVICNAGMNVSIKRDTLKKKRKRKTKLR